MEPTPRYTVLITRAVAGRLLDLPPNTSAALVGPCLFSALPEYVTTLTPDGVDVDVERVERIVMTMEDFVHHPNGEDATQALTEKSQRLGITRPDWALLGLYIQRPKGFAKATDLDHKCMCDMSLQLADQPVIFGVGSSLVEIDDGEYTEPQWTLYRCGELLEDSSWRLFGEGL